MKKVVFAGDISFLGVEDPDLAFQNISSEFLNSDLTFGNLECCFFEPKRIRTLMPRGPSGDVGIYVPLSYGKTLVKNRFTVVGTANNQNFGEEAVVNNIRILDSLGISQVGSGVDRARAKEPHIQPMDGLNFGLLQRTSVYWPIGHEAADNMPGVATLKAHTAYQPPYHNECSPPSNRPGVAPKIVTWVDSGEMASFKGEVSAAKSKSDFLVCSQHWGLGEQVLDYQTEIAHAAIDSGADLVLGHGPHYLLPIEIYKGKPIFYGIGSLCFVRDNHQYYKGLHGMIVVAKISKEGLRDLSFKIVSQDDKGIVRYESSAKENKLVSDIVQRSRKFGTSFDFADDAITVSLD